MANKEFKKIIIKNYTCYYFNHIINTNYLNLDDILLDDKSYKNNFVYCVIYTTPCKTFMNYFS